MEELNCHTVDVSKGPFWQVCLRGGKPIIGSGIECKWKRVAAESECRPKQRYEWAAQRPVTRGCLWSSGGHERERQ
eukprot:1187032-Alexandrium_andersonii.AAC.1